MNTKSSSLTIPTENEIKLSSEMGIPISSKPPCTICLDKSSGFHYGTHACEGCKGFFRRMVTNSILIQLVLQCTGSRKYQCDINPSTRNNCQRCRLQKCFQMGMTRYKTRLGRRTKAISLKLERSVLPCIVNSFLDDEEMLKLIKRENKYFNNNAIEEEKIEDEIPEGKCIKYKAKLYSEKNCKIYQKFPITDDLKKTSSSLCCNKDTKPETTNCSTNLVSSNNENHYLGFQLTSNNLDQPEDINVSYKQTFQKQNENVFNFSKPLDKNPCLYSQSSFANYSLNLNSYDLGYDKKSNTTNENYELTNNKIRLISEKYQIKKLCSKVRIFRNCNSNNKEYQLFIKCKVTINSLTEYFYHPNLEEMEEYYRTRVDQVSFVFNPLLVFSEMVTGLSEMARNIFSFFKLLPDLGLYDIISRENSCIKKKIIQTLYVWLIKFVNVPENLIYNTTLTMKIPKSVLFQTPLKHFFELLFKFAKNYNSVLTMEIDDFETSLISALIVTSPVIESNIWPKTTLQSDNILKLRFYYFASLYDHIFTERCTQNHDITENRLQKLYWLISETDLLNESNVNFIFSHFNM